MIIKEHNKKWVCLLGTGRVNSGVLHCNWDSEKLELDWTTSFNCI